MPTTGLRSLQTLVAAGTHLNRHLLCLHLSVSLPSGDQHCIYSGFLLDYRTTAVWVTAGHVIHEIEELRALESAKIFAAGWLDGFDINKGERRPADITNWLAFRVDRGALDLGFVVLRPYDLTHLEASKSKEFLTDTDLAADFDQLPSTMYLIGTPHLTLRVHSEEVGMAATRFDFTSHPICVACTPIADQKQQESTFWGQKNCFYLRAEPVPGADGALIDDFHGMSGGPVFGIFEGEPGTLQYRLYGIQSACSDANALHLRITDIKMLTDAIDVVLKTVSEKHGTTFPERKPHGGWSLPPES